MTNFSKDNHRNEFASEVENLVKLGNILPETRCKLSEELTETYFSQVGILPDSYELQKLTTWIVRDYENDPDKITNTEFPCLTPRQLKGRSLREFPAEYVENLHGNSKYRINGKIKPKRFKTFGTYFE